MKWIVLGLGLALPFVAVAGTEYKSLTATEYNPVEAFAANAAASSVRQKCSTQYRGTTISLSTFTTTQQPRYWVQATALCSYHVPDPGNVYAIAKNVTNTEVHQLKSVGNYQSFVSRVATALGNSAGGTRFQFAVDDFNKDGVEDLYAIKRDGTHSTEVHVLAGPNFTTWLGHFATALGKTGSGNDWKFLVGDYNADGKPDLYAIKKVATTTEVHVLNGADNFQTFLTHLPTATGPTGSDLSYDFALGDFNNDNKNDVYVIAKTVTGSGKTEVHVLDGATSFASYLGHFATPIGPTGSDNRYEFAARDHNRDGRDELYIFGKGDSGLEVHVFSASSGFASPLLQTTTPLQMNTSGGDFQIILGHPK